MLVANISKPLSNPNAPTKQARAKVEVLRNTAL